MKHSYFRTLIILCSLVLVSASASCTEYWWTRGQAPGVDKLMSQAQNSLKDAMSSDAHGRKQMGELARSLESAVIAAHKSVKSNDEQAGAKLAAVVDNFAALEGKLSITSRAPYAELYGQARTLRDKAAGENGVEEGAVGLFAARTIFFLANEMSVPAPSFGA